MKNLQRIKWKVKSLLGFKDYWSMRDKNLILLANSKNILDMYDFGTTTHDDFISTELTREGRKLIIDASLKNIDDIRNYAFSCLKEYRDNFQLHDPSRKEEFLRKFRSYVDIDTYSDHYKTENTPKKK